MFYFEYWEESPEKVLSKSDEGIIIGYSSNSKAYKFYNKRTQCVEESIHVVFDEGGSSGEGHFHDDEILKNFSIPQKTQSSGGHKIHEGIEEPIDSQVPGLTHVDKDDSLDH